MRTGVGTVKSFRGDPSFTCMGIERCGNVAVLIVSPDLAARLVETYGVRESYEWTSMEAVVGLRCRWTENRIGVLVDLEPLCN